MGKNTIQNRYPKSYDKKFLKYFFGKYRISNPIKIIFFDL